MLILLEASLPILYDGLFQVGGEILILNLSNISLTLRILEFAVFNNVFDFFFKLVFDLKHLLHQLFFRHDLELVNGHYFRLHQDQNILNLHHLLDSRIVCHLPALTQTLVYDLHTRHDLVDLLVVRMPQSHFLDRYPDGLILQIDPCLLIFDIKGLFDGFNGLPHIFEFFK